MGKPMKQKNLDLQVAKMKKIKVVSLLMMCILGFLFAFRRDIGAKVNDKYKQALLKQYFGTEKAAALNVLETTAFCGNEQDSGRFIIWVGVVAKSDLSYEQLGNLLDRLYEKTLNVECIPYNMDFANSHGFTGIQKETMGAENTKGYYIIGITFEPKTLLDTRNR